jgi:hypothetical protein
VNAVSSLLVSFFLVALATTLVLPGRQTPALVKNFFDGLASATSAVIAK